MRTTEKEKEITYELVDTEGLATVLAEDAWKEEVKVKGITEDQLYEIDDQNKKIVRSHWATSFFLLRDAFLDLIHQFKKP